MSLTAVFIFGFFVTMIVAAACLLLVQGILADKRDREAGPDAGL
jgi:hypothetical protein